MPITLKEQIIMNHIAFELIQYGDYDLLHINEQNNEIWLEKYENRESKVIRLTTVGFDWKNELQRDITKTINRVQGLGRLLVGRKINVQNIYVSQFAPVDNWEMLKRPIYYKGPKEMNIHVYYINQENYEDEIKRFSKDVMHISFPEIDLDPIVLQANLQNYELYLRNLLIEKRKRDQAIFSYGKPIFTYLLIGLNILYFFIIEMFGSSTDVPHLVQFGAKFNPLIMDHEWWRILTSMFIHIGFIHLFMNMIALFYLGTAVERIFGPAKFLIIYFLGGIVGGLASFAFTTNVSAGASGAIFGLFGAILFFGLKERKLFLQTIGRPILIIIVFNVIIGFTAPQIDNSAHLGGLLAGFLSSGIVNLPNRKEMSKRIFATIGYIVIASTMVFFGFNNKDNIVTYNLIKIEDHLAQDEFNEIIKLVDESLPYSENDQKTLLLYFQRSIAYINLGEYEAATVDLEKTIEIDDKFHSSHYNLALLYKTQGEDRKAEESIETAYKLNPNDKKYYDMYVEIIGKEPTID